MSGSANGVDGETAPLIRLVPVASAEAEGAALCTDGVCGWGPDGPTAAVAPAAPPPKRSGQRTI